MIFVPTSKRIIRPGDKPSFEHTQRYGLIRGHPLGPAGGLVLFHAMNSGAGNIVQDLSDCGHIGTLVGHTYWVPGRSGPALSLDGTGDFVQTILSVPALEVTNVTLVIWARSSDWSRTQVALWKHHSSDADTNYYIRTAGSRLVGGIYVSAGHSVTGSIPLVNNFGYHLALTYDGETLKCYVNGIFDNQNTTPSGDLQTGTRRLCLGAKSNSTNPFLGLFDYAKVWNRALSASEIALDCAEPFCMVQKKAAPVYFFVPAVAPEVPTYQNFTEAKAGVPAESLTITKPAGVVENSLMVAAVTRAASSTSDVLAPNGWSELADYYYGGSSLAVFYKVAGGDEAADYEFTWSGSKEAYGFIIHITGHDNANPIDIDDWNIGTSDAPECDSVNTTEDDCLILRIFGADKDFIDVDSGYPAAHTGITVDKSSPSGDPCCGGAAWKVQAIAGATGDATFSMTDSENWCAMTIAIAPPLAVVDVTVTPSTLELTLTQHEPDLVIGCTVTPATLELALTQHAPTIAFGATITPSTLELALTLLAPVISADCTVTPDALALILTQHAPTAGGFVTVTPSTLELILTQHAPTLAFDYTVAPTTLALALTLLAPTIDTGAVIITPDTFELIATLLSPEIIAVCPVIPPFMHKDLIDPYSGGAWLWLYEISVPGYETQRAACNSKDVIYGGITFPKGNFRPGQQSLAGDASIPRIILQVAQDRDRVLEDIVNATKGGANGTVKIIRTCEKFLETPVTALEATYSILTAGSDVEWVTFVLGIPNPLVQRIPLWLYSSKVCVLATPSLFKGPRCQYAGPDTVCTGLFEDCYTKGNAAHWGAEMGLDPNAVRV